jgi:RimJ/RimL family protein N-acetyltransferase
VALKRGNGEQARDVFRFLAAYRRGDPERAQRMCGRSRHVVQMPDLRLQSPSMQDGRAMAAGASDPRAQRWLGWTDGHVLQAQQWTDLLDAEPGRGRRLPRAPGSREMCLAAVDPSGRRLAGWIEFTRETGEIGGWLAPEFRGRGLGAALFGGAAEFAHHHLGAISVLAGTEPANAACIGALTAAGFIPAPGPETHTLPNGRVAAARWFRHESVRPALCSAAPAGNAAIR